MRASNGGVVGAAQCIPLVLLVNCCILGGAVAVIGREPVTSSEGHGSKSFACLLRTLLPSTTRCGKICRDGEVKEILAAVTSVDEGYGGSKVRVDRSDIDDFFDYVGHVFPALHELDRGAVVLAAAALTPNLTSFVLHEHEGLEEGEAQALCTVLRTNTGFRHLQLVLKNMGGSKHVANLLRHHSVLKNLHLLCVGGGLKMITKALLPNTTLECLTLGGNVFRHLSVFLQQPDCALKRLILLSFDHADGFGIAELAKSLASKNTFLERLCSKTEFDSEYNAKVGAALGKMLQANTSLRTVEMCNTKMDEKGGKHFVNWFSHNSTLISLAFSDPNLGEANMESLHSHLTHPSDSSLTRWCLKYNSE